MTRRSKRKFHRHTYTFEVLSEEELDDSYSLEELSDMTMIGECSGQLVDATHETVDGRTMAKLLIKQGSDPGFFMLTEGDDR